MLTIRFVLVGMMCLLPQFALLANDKGDVAKASLATKQVKYADIKAVKNNPSLTVNFFRDGKEIGSWPFSDSDGGRWRWENAPDITGRITFYYGDILIGKGLMIKSMKQGKWLEYDENNGRLRGEYLYVDDNRNGPFKEYSESGALSEEGIFISGNEYVYEKGPYKTFYPTGELKSKCEGAEELGEGSYSEKGCVNYNKKGGLFQTKADGVEREYYENGTLIKENIIDAGLNGTERIFYDSGKLKSVSKSHPVGQELDANTIEYYESGKIRREYVRITTATYQNNSVWGAMEWSKSLQTEDDKQYFESGKLKYHIAKRSESEYRNTMTDHGLSSSMTIVNVGTHEEFYESGKHLLVGSYTNNPGFKYYEPAGTWTCYFPSGEVEMMAVFTGKGGDGMVGEEYFITGKKKRVLKYDGSNILYDQRYAENGEKVDDVPYADTEVVRRIVDLLQRRIMACEEMAKGSNGARGQGN